MKLEVKRVYKESSYTIGELYTDGKLFCYTAEDPDRGLKDSMTLNEIMSLKINGSTAIPIGEYEVSLNTVSPKYSNYTKYSWAKDIEAKVPRLLNVKGFNGVLIHPSGNSSKDTLGCILVGKDPKNGMIYRSQETFKELYKLLKEASDKGEQITINIE